MKKTLTLFLSATIAVGGVALAPLAPPASAGCASYPGATVVKCVRDTPKPTKAQKKKKQFKRLSVVNRRVARVNLDEDHPVREPNLPKRLSIVWTLR